MPNIFQRIAKGIGDLLGIGAAPPPPPPTPPAPPREPEFPEEEPEEYFPPEEEEQPAEEIDIPYHPPENDIIYIPRSGSVLGRWEVGTETSPPTLDAWYYFGGANTIEEYFNELLRLSTVVWKRIDTVQVLDKRKP